MPSNVFSFISITSLPIVSAYFIKLSFLGFVTEVKATRHIEGVAVINRDRDWNKNNNNTFQIVYLDVSNIILLEDFICFIINLIHSEDAVYDRIQVYCPQTTSISTFMEQLGQERSEQFLLYKREI